MNTLRNGVHMIAVRSADGTLVVGDSHHYGGAPEPCAASEVEDEIVGDLSAATSIEDLDVLERWSGIYAAAADRPMFAVTPLHGVRVVIVTDGTGASTAFTGAEEVIADLFTRKIEIVSAMSDCAG